MYATGVGRRVRGDVDGNVHRAGARHAGRNDALHHGAVDDRDGNCEAVTRARTRCGERCRARARAARHHCEAVGFGDLFDRRGERRRQCRFRIDQKCQRCGKRSGDRERSAGCVRGVRHRDAGIEVVAGPCELRNHRVDDQRFVGEEGRLAVTEASVGRRSDRHDAPGCEIVGQVEGHVRISVRIGHDRAGVVRERIELAADARVLGAARETAAVAPAFIDGPLERLQNDRTAIVGEARGDRLVAVDLRHEVGRPIAAELQDRIVGDDQRDLAAHGQMRAVGNVQMDALMRRGLELCVQRGCRDDEIFAVERHVEGREPVARDRVTRIGGVLGG